MSFIHDDFLLSNPAARELYHTFAKAEPIYDYHCHLPPAQIANNHRFADLAEVWLGGDHYKWRALRTNGVAERFVTGDASPREKFDAWCATVPQTLRNPLYHWSHLELTRYFGISDRLDPASAQAIWDRVNPQLATPACSATSTTFAPPAATCTWRRSMGRPACRARSSTCGDCRVS
jgi:glucuronate isomerase